MAAKHLYNRSAGVVVADGAPPADALGFHRSFPAYEKTALHAWPALAEELEVRQVYVKDESSRLGLPSFKIMGASWAVACALAEKVPDLFEGPPRLDNLRREALPDLTLLAATDGNHGHAVARLATLLGIGARILVPSNLSRERVAAIEAEGADVEIVDGTYDDAVRQSAREADEDRLLISDTSWPGYETTPRRVIEGYSTILREVDEDLAPEGVRPDLVFVQMGVGAFAAAVTRHYRSRADARTPRIVGVEPLHAACVMASLAAGEVVEIPGPHDSIMAGLNCGTPSMLAWPVLQRGLDAVVAIDDDAARDAMLRFDRAGMVAGECAAAGPAGAIELLLGPDAPEHRRRLSVHASTVILLFLTEGATDPTDYRAVVGHDPAVRP